MSHVVDQFITRLFNANKSRWWANLSSETRKSKYGKSARFLEETLAEEMSDVREYRGSGRQLFFFSNSQRSTIDGRYGNLGVEEKYNPLDIGEHLIDGAIHRGLVWILGNPQHLTSPGPEAVTIYVVRKGSEPMSSQVTDLFFPVLTATWKVGGHIIFVKEETGEYWRVIPNFSEMSLPGWLSTKKQPAQWDRELENLTDRNRKALDVLADQENLGRYQKRISSFPELGGRTIQFTEVIINESIRAAIMDYGNEWRLLEWGLLLRSKGYVAVKVLYNSTKHKNATSRSRPLTPAGKGVERKIHDEMMKRFAVMIDWGVKV
jgi:hypothetical protein